MNRTAERMMQEAAAFHAQHAPMVVRPVVSLTYFPTGNRLPVAKPAANDTFRREGESEDELFRQAVAGGFVPEGYERDPDYPGEGYSSPFRKKKGSK